MIMHEDDRNQNEMINNIVFERFLNRGPKCSRKGNGGYSYLYLDSTTMDTPEEQPLKYDVTETTKPKRTIKERIIHVKQNITLEPILFCYVVPGVLARLAMQNLNLDKACRVNLGYGDLVCDALVAKKGNQYQEQERIVQELIASMEIWKNILLTGIPSLLILFLGAWSDRTGKRKMCILMPIVGDLLMCLSNMLNTYFFYEIPVQATMFFEAFFPAIMGGWVATYLGAFSYISDISSEESRTFRVGVANLCLTAGSPLGSALSGVLLTSVGYYGVFGLSSLLYLFSLIYGFYYIKDPERVVTGKNTKYENSGPLNFLKNFFDLNHVKDAFRVTFKKGPNNRRTKSILVFAAIAFVYAPSHGEFTVRYYFTRYRFNWDAVKYSIYNTYFICTHALGALISITLVSKILKWDDSVLGLLSNCSHIVGAMITALARTGRDMYVAVTIEMFNASSFTALRSISSKLVPSDELGKMISLFNLMEILTSMVSAPVYSWFYMMTLSHDAGAFYYVSVVLSIPAILIFLWFFIQHRKTVQLQSKAAVNSEESCHGEPTTLLNKEVLVNSIDLTDKVLGGC